jgi:hypothetical protein
LRHHADVLPDIQQIAIAFRGPIKVQPAAEAPARPPKSCRRVRSMEYS